MSSAVVSRGRWWAGGSPRMRSQIGVELAGHPGPDLARPEQPAVLGGRGAQLVDVGARPAADEAGVQQLAERLDVEALVRLEVVDGVLVAGRGERRGHAEPDDAHRAGLLEQHVMRGEPAVVDAVLVRVRDGLGDLGHDPGGAGARQRRLGEQLVEREGPGPLADDEVLPVIVLDEVEHAQEPGIGDGGGQASRLDEVVGPRVAARDHLDADVAVEDAVVRAPGDGAEPLGDEILELVAVGEDVAGRHRAPLAHRHPFREIRSQC